MTKQEKLWLWLDWQDGKDIEFICEEYDVTEAEAYVIIKEQLGIRTNKDEGDSS